MAKTIKFNLYLDGNKVRTLEELRENFSVEDILDYFKKDVLLSWLEGRGYQEEYEKVNRISRTKTDEAILLDLIQIFKVNDMNQQKVQKALRVLKYLDDKKKKDEVYRKNAFKREQIIDDYIAEYYDIYKQVRENKDDFEVLKHLARIVDEDYYALFCLDFEDMYFTFKNDYPKALFAFSTRASLWKKWLGKDAREHLVKNFRGFLSSPSTIEKVLGADMNIYSKNTSNTWISLEKKGKRIMVVYLSPGVLVRGAGRADEAGSEINGMLLDFDGLEFKSNSSSSKIMYVEV